MTSATTIILVLYFIQGSLGHACVGLPQSPVVGVTGGHAVDITDAPFMAALLGVASHSSLTFRWCGGSIIHERFVLTSGYCIVPNITVRVGATRYDEGGKLYQVEKYIKHESYTRETRYINNVGLLKLSESVTFGPTVSRIRLADDNINIPVGLPANVTGWGETKNLPIQRALQQASVTVSPQDDCDTYFAKKLTDKQVCVNKEATGACYLDYGDPLTVGDLQIGIYLYGATCWGEPNVYEKVAPHLQWIRNKIKENL